jgi:hypothetical protein
MPLMAAALLETLRMLPTRALLDIPCSSRLVLVEGALATAATVVAPAMAVVAFEVSSGSVGGRLGFSVAASADGDAVEDETGRSSHRAGFFGVIGRNAGVSAVKPSLQYMRAGRNDRKSGSVCDVGASGRNVAAGTIASDRGSGAAVRKAHELPSVHLCSFANGARFWPVWRQDRSSREDSTDLGLKADISFFIWPLFSLRGSMVEVY